MQFSLPTGTKPGARPLPENWSNLVSLLRRRVPFITEALGVIPILVNDNLPHPVQSDGKAIQINPDLWDEMCAAAHETPEEPWFPTDNAGMAYMTLRSCLQMVLRYDQRRGTRDRKIWAESVDNITNQMLVDIFKMEPFSYSNGGVKNNQLRALLDATGRYDSRFFGKTVEQTYEVLELERQKSEDEPPPDGVGPEGEDNPNKQPGEGKGKPPKGKPPEPKKDEEEKDDSSGDGDQDKDKDETPSTGNPPKQQPKDQDQDQDDQGDGDGDGDDQDDQPDQPGDGVGTPTKPSSSLMGDDLGDSVPDSGIGDDLGQLVDNSTQDYLQRHGQKLAGTGSAAAREVGKALEKAPILLKDVLKKIRDVLPGVIWNYRKAGKNDMCFKRQRGFPIRMPAPSSDPGDKIREIVVVLDLSASMSEEEIRAGIKIVQDAFKHTGRGRKIRLICFTTQVVIDTELTATTAKDIKLGFSGGTRIYSAMEWIDEHKIKPSVIILVTDGECGTLEQIRTWHYLPRLRTILVRSSEWVGDRFPGQTFKVDKIT